MVTTKILFCFAGPSILLHKIPQGLLLPFSLFHYFLEDPSLSPMGHTCAIYLGLFPLKI